MIFSPDTETRRMLCGNISIVMDDVVENTENFFVFIDSMDSAIIVSQNNASVDVIDSSSKHQLVIQWNRHKKIKMLHENEIVPCSYYSERTLYIQDAMQKIILLGIFFKEPNQN